MSDQATELRKLVLRAMRDSQPNAGPAPRLILLTSGQTSVGVTTLAVNLAVALAEQGSRIVLVDADSHANGIASLCGLDAEQSLADVLIARRDIHEALRLGPAGIQVIPGLWRPGQEPEVSSIALERLMRQLTKLGRHADAVLVDVGNGANDLVRRLSSAADDVIVATTPETAAVMDAYARIKLTLSGHANAPISLLVNRSSDEQQTQDIFKRIDQSCRRFLGHGLDLLGGIPEDNDLERAADIHSPLMLSRPDSAFAQAIQRAAVCLIGLKQTPEQNRRAA